jgi:HK97 family phage major capsid protein
MSEEIREKIASMTMDEVTARMSEINSEVEAYRTADPSEDTIALIEARTAELEELTARKDALTEIQERQAAAEKINEGSASGITEIETRTGETTMAIEYNANSAEYRSAFLKNLMDVPQDEWSEAERAAFVHTTANTAAVLPTTTLNQIWSLIEEQHPIVADVTVYRYNTIMEIVKHTAIAKGDAAEVAENAAPADDEKNTFVKVTLSGKDFAKDVEISYALAKMSIDGLESYLVKEISDRMGAAIAADIVAQLGTDYDSTNNNIVSATAGELEWDDIVKAFGALKRAGAVTVYATRSTIYNYLVSMTDTTGRPLFQPSMQAGVEGTLLGANVKVEDAVAEKTFWIGDPKKFVENFVQDVMIESDKDIKRHVYIYSGYARAEGVLVDPQAFSKLTVKNA